MDDGERAPLQFTRSGKSAPFLLSDEQREAWWQEFAAWQALQRDFEAWMERVRGCKR